MKTNINKFDYHLPKELIAKYPAKNRDNCKLMMVDVRNESISHYIFSDIVDLLTEDDFLVVNNTKVRNARLYVKKVTGGASEIFVTDVIDDNNFYGLVRGKLKKGDKLLLENIEFNLLEKYNDGLWLIKASQDINKIMADFGHVPLPPYINRDDEIGDKQNYQTVYAKDLGSSAAPTAGLHFTDKLLDKIKAKGIEVIEITLNVGLGTFQPVKVEYLEDHEIHKEKYNIPEIVADRINTLKSKGKKLMAVGTTSVRALESASNDNGFIKSGEGVSSLYIIPPYKFKVVDNLITNFHLPKSTLLALVSAFAGYDLIMKAYDMAINNNYKFFSYGDGMLIRRG